MCAIPTTPWTAPNQSWPNANSGEGAITSTTIGDTQPKPIRMPGSSVGAIPTAYTTAANAVYPVYDGVTVGQVYDRNGTPTGIKRQSLAIDPQTGLLDYSRYPATFYTNLSPLTLNANPPDFTNWHSAFQAEYIALRPIPGGGSTPEYKITTGTAPNETTVALYMLDDKFRPVNLMALSLSDYAKLTDTEKLRFNDNLVAAGVLDNLGLSTELSVKQSLVGTLSPQVGLKGNLALISSSVFMSAAEKGLFSAQIQMLIDEVGDPAVAGPPAVSTAKITDAADKIMGRFKVLDAFVSAPRPSSVSIYGNLHLKTGSSIIEFGPQSATSTTLVQESVSCLDDGAAMDKGIQAFVKAESEILNMKQRRAIIAENSAYRDPNLDVPNLIYQLQLLYEGESKGVVDAGTEEFRQLHKLLEDYNIMQQLLSTTISYFDGGKTDEKRRFMNIGLKDDGDVDEDQAFFTPRNEDLGYLRDYQETYDGSSYINSDEHVPKYHWSLLADYSPEDNLSDLHRDFAEWNSDNDISTGGNNYADPGDVTGKLDRTEMLAFSMFADESWANVNNRWHPIEKLYGAPRPEFDLIDESEEGAGSLQLYSKNTFDQFQTKLSSTITILNQQNQIKQNDVENATKEQNRHFELGNNALRKMNDLLLMIGRS